MNWLNYLNGKRTNQLLEMVGIRRRHNTRNGIMISILGLGLGAAAYGMMRGRNEQNDQTNRNNILQPVERLMDQIRNPVSFPNQQK